MKNIFKKDRPRDTFFREKITRIFSEKKYIVDIGGGLRLDPTKNNRKREHEWVDPYLKTVKYVVLDEVPDYKPDIVGDVHNLPLLDNSVDAMICMHLLEHVEEPQKAMKEIHRVLKPGGYLYVDVPFIFYYHPMKGYYKDYYRFTKDGLEYMARDFTTIEIQNVRGALSTVMNMLPFFSRRTKIFEIIDRVINKENSEQTGAHRMFCIK